MTQTTPRTASVAGIELAIFGAEEHQGAPVVFALHGRTGRAEHMFDLCRQLVKVGLIAIAFDQRNHGGRMVDARGNGEWSPHHAADMYGNQLGTAMDVSLLIDMLPARLGIDTAQVGMTGISMGGHATLLSMVIDPRIAVGVAFIGSGDYRWLMELRAAQHACPAEEFSIYFPAALQAAVERHDPITHPAAFADRPLLLANGAADTAVPAECNQRFLAACRPYYTQQERLHMETYPGVGHECPTEMLASGVAWLQRWLLSEKI
jgi:dienelactone hydrolase